MVKSKKKIKNNKTENKTKFVKIKANLVGGNVFSNTKEAMNLYAKSRFGEHKEGKIVYSLVEALFLLETKRMGLYFQGKKLKFEEVMNRFLRLDRRIHIKYDVFKDMRRRGYIVKTALKFGAEFRVYDKGIKPGEDHAKWILYPVKENEKSTWHEFSAKNRVAHSTKKNLLIGVVDEEGDVTYYEVTWTKP